MVCFWMSTITFLFWFVLLSAITNPYTPTGEGRCVRAELVTAGLVFIMARILLLCLELNRRWEEESSQAKSNLIPNLGLLWILLSNIAIAEHLKSWDSSLWGCLKILWDDWLYRYAYIFINYEFMFIFEICFYLFSHLWLLFIPEAQELADLRIILVMISSSGTLWSITFKKAWVLWQTIIMFWIMFGNSL